MYKYALFSLVLFSHLAFTQQFEWGMVAPDNSDLPNQTVKSIAIDSSGAIWYGTYMGGIAVEKDGEWTIYNTSNSDLPHNYVNSITVDRNNVKWIGTDGGGLARFDDQKWEIYKTSNSGIPSNVVMTVYCDDDGTVWVGTYFGGLAAMNNGLWEVYNDQNSNLLSNKVVCIARDQKDILWIGTQGGGVASFDGTNWNVYTEINSKLTNNYIYSIAVDHENKKWIGTGGGGLVVFNDVYWVKHTTDNSGLTDDNIRPIVIGPAGTKWIGTYIGGINTYNGKTWSTYDFQNSPMPDDEITSMTYFNNTLYVGTERSGVVQVTTLQAEEAVPEELPVAITPVIVDDKFTEGETEEELVVSEDTEEPVSIEPVETPAPATATITALKPDNKIVLVMDAADVFFDQNKLNLTIRSFKYLLNKREKIDNSYEVRVVVYSSNFDVDPRKIVLDEKQKKELHAKDIIYLDGESSFTEGIKKAFNLIKLDYNETANNHVMAATHKFIRDDETAKVVVKDNLDNHYIVFSLLAFKNNSWKLEAKMRQIVPRGSGHYYSITQPGMLDNWSVTAQFGASMFRGDIDVNKFIAFPGVIGVAVNKQVLSTGVVNGGIKLQFNFGKLKGEKSQYTFKNNYFEGCLNFQAIMNRWINQNFRFETIRPYAFAGIGFIRYRALLKDQYGNAINGIGYEVEEGNLEANGSDPSKTNAVTDLMFPVGLGANYKVNDQINIELEASSRFISSDRLDARVNWKDDKYWFVSLGVTYKINSKPFLSDILSK